MEDSDAKEKQAIVQGELHLSDKDATELLDRDLEEWDTLLVEGRDALYQLEDAEFGFAYYAIGAISVRSIVQSVHQALQLAGMNSPSTLRNLNIDKNDRIDAQHREIWSFTNQWFRSLLLTFAVVGSVAALYDTSLLSKIHSGFFESWHTILFVFPFLPGLVHILSVVNPTNSRRRNEKMVSNIEEYTSENDYDRILVLVGEMHRPGITEGLKQSGWKVNSKETNIPVGRQICRIYRALGDW